MMTQLEEKQLSLKTSLDELKKEKSILDALSIDYTSTYYCDLEEDKIIVLKQGQYTNSIIVEQSLTEGLQSYSVRIKYYYDTFVIKESAPDFLEKLSADYLKQYLQENERFAYRFQATPNLAGQQYFEVQVVRLTGQEGFKVVMGYRYVDDIVEEQEKQRIRLETALAEVTLNSEIIDSISKIYWLIYRMDLVNSVLDMNKLESGAVVLENEPFDLRDLLDESNNIIKMSAEVEGLKIIFKKDTILHTHLLGSAIHLKQILQNISGNAVKYNQKGGSIELSCKETRYKDGIATYRFVCKDTGIGMSEEFIPHVFEPFAQEEQDARTDTSGRNE